MSAVAQPAGMRPRAGSPLMYLLVFVSVTFIGILIFAYIVTRRSHPVYLDEHGRPVNSQPAQPHGAER